MIISYRDYLDLSRWKPERPFSSQVFGEYCYEPFKWSEYCSVNHHRSFMTWFKGLLSPLELLRTVFIWFENLSFKLVWLFSVRRITSCFVLQIESYWQIKVKLNSPTLDSSTKCIIDLYINFWTIKRSVSFIDSPLFTRLIKCLS